jgi:hypothetical protein
MAKPRLLHLRCRKHGIRKLVTYTKGKLDDVRQAWSQLKKKLDAAQNLKEREAIWQAGQLALATSGGCVGHHKHHGQRNGGLNSRMGQRASVLQSIAAQRGAWIKLQTAGLQLQQPDAMEMASFVTYVKLREKASSLDYPLQAPQPTTQKQLEWQVLQQYHFCNNTRRHDKTARAFSAAMQAVTDPATVLLNAAVLALLPRFQVLP